MELKKEIEILEPFLKKHDFELKRYEKTNEEWRNLFAVATYKNGKKQFIIKHIQPIIQVFYQFDKHKVHHSFYLKQLGVVGSFECSEIKNFYEEKDTKKDFANLLHDFLFLVEDFFHGECVKLQEFSKIHNKTLTEYHTKAHEEFSIHFDELKIKTAKEAYQKKELKKCLDVYKKVENRKLINGVDERIIDYCNKYSIYIK